LTVPVYSYLANGTQVTSNDYTYTFASAQTTWVNWVSMANSTSGTSNETWNGLTAQTVWTIWAGLAVKLGTVSSAPVQFSEAQRAEYERQREVQREQALEHQRQREAAEIRADELLYEFIDAMQIEELVRDKSITVLSETGKTFKVFRNRSVREYDENGKLLGYHCIHPNIQVPSGDEMLAQMLLLQTDEKSFRRISNFTHA
jgi:hypothetical protein